MTSHAQVMTLYLHCKQLALHMHHITTVQSSIKHHTCTIQEPYHSVLFWGVVFETSLFRCSFSKISHYNLGITFFSVAFTVLFEYTQIVLCCTVHHNIIRYFMYDAIFFVIFYFTLFIFIRTKHNNC